MSGYVYGLDRLYGCYIKTKGRGQCKTLVSLLKISIPIFYVSALWKLLAYHCITNNGSTRSVAQEPHKNDTSGEYLEATLAALGIARNVMVLSQSFWYFLELLLSLPGIPWKLHPYVGDTGEGVFFFLHFFSPHQAAAANGKWEWVISHSDWNLGSLTPNPCPRKVRKAIAQ